MDVWNIGLPSWVIQDGNYGNVQCNQVVPFAVEFLPHDLAFSNPTNQSANFVSDSIYRIAGKIVFADDDSWVVDFGLAAFQNERPPDGVHIGEWVQGHIGLGIDPYFYVASLARKPSMLPLIYTWHIDRIRLQTAPYVETSVMGSKVMVRDRAKLGYADIEQTDAWKDDGGNGEYLLTCTRLDLPPHYGGRQRRRKRT